MAPYAPDDSDLVAAALAGDREAFGQLYDRHARMVRAVVAGVSGDWAAVDDMAQECFLRAYRKLPTLRDASGFRAWIAGIARHVGRERRRSLRRDRHEFGEHGPLDIALSDTAQSGVDERDQIALVMQRVDELPDEERLAIHSYYLHQQDAQRAAEVAGLSRSGFYVLLQRAIARLANGLQAVANQETNER